MRRMNKKSWMVLLTCVCMTFGMTACGSTQTQNDATVIGESAAETEIDESTDETAVDESSITNNETQSTENKEKKDNIYMGQITAIADNSITMNLVDRKDSKPMQTKGEPPKDGEKPEESTDKQMKEPPTDETKPDDMEMNLPLSGEEMILNVSDTTKYYEYKDGKKVEISIEDLAADDLITVTMENDNVITVTKGTEIPK